MGLQVDLYSSFISDSLSSSPSSTCSLVIGEEGGSPFTQPVSEPVDPMLDWLAVEGVCESVGLPRRPICPAPNAPGADDLLQRPEVNQQFAELYPQLTDTYNKVRAIGVPNYRGARVPLVTALNIDNWRKFAHIYDDPSLPDMLEYGFPAGYLGLKPPASRLSNHASSLRNPTQVEAYLEKECRLGAMAGPFPVQPFESWSRNNPLMTRPKRNSTDLRVILDLSFPKGESVNSAIPKESLDNASFKLKLPTPIDFAERIREKGQGCLLYKVDLSRAYRQLRSDPWTGPCWEWIGKRNTL